jgi:hypothetical protein
MKGRGVTRQVGVRLTDADYARLERLAGALSVRAIVRAALLVGLDFIEEQPGVLLGKSASGRRCPGLAAHGTSGPRSLTARESEPMLRRRSADSV